MAVILVARDGENEIVVVPGANRELVPTDYGIDDADAVPRQFEVPIDAVSAAAGQARGMFCLNAAPARPVPEAVLARADVIVATSLEVEALGSSPLGSLFALTLGAEGALPRRRGGGGPRGTRRVNAVDGTAAGDAFCACLVVSLLEGRPREEALDRACAAGAVAASRCRRATVPSDGGRHRRRTRGVSPIPIVLDCDPGYDDAIGAAPGAGRAPARGARRDDGRRNEYAPVNDAEKCAPGARALVAAARAGSGRRRDGRRP